MIYRVGQKSDTSRTLHYIVREVSLFWPTQYVLNVRVMQQSAIHRNCDVITCHLIFCTL